MIAISDRVYVRANLIRKVYVYETSCQDEKAKGAWCVMVEYDGYNDHTMVEKSFCATKEEASDESDMIVSGA